MSEALRLIQMEFGGETPSEIIINYFTNIEKNEEHPLSRIINEDQACICGKESSVYVCAIGVDRSYQSYIPVKVPPSLRNVYIRPNDEGLAKGICDNCLKSKVSPILVSFKLGEANSNVIFKYVPLESPYTDSLKLDDFFLIERSSADKTFKNIHIYTRQELDTLWSELSPSGENELERMKASNEMMKKQIAQIREEARKQNDPEVRHAKWLEERFGHLKGLSQEELLEEFKNRWNWQEDNLRKDKENALARIAKKGRVLRYEDGVCIVEVKNEEAVRKMTAKFAGATDSNSCVDNASRMSFEYGVPFEYRFVSK